MPPDTTPIPEQPAQTVGGMDPRQAGALEIIRGAGTTGGGVLLLWWLLTGEIDALAKRLDERATTTDARIAALAADIGTLRVDIARLQVQVDVQDDRAARPAPPR